MAQTSPRWSAMVIGDSVKDLSPKWPHPHVFYSNLVDKLGHSNCGGIVRNYGLSCAGGKWLAFVDDDDVVDNHYVEWLVEECNDMDVVVFRMKMGDSIIPSGGSIGPGDVGISFAVRSEFQYNQGVWFVNDPMEDWIFISNCQAKGARIKISDRIAYYVRP